MKAQKIIAFFCGIVFFGAGLSSSPTSQFESQKFPIGNWSGILDVKVMKLTLVLEISETDSGLKGKFSCLEQDIASVEVDRIDLDNEKIQFQIAELGARYDGSLNGNGTAISGQFSQGGVSFPLSFEFSEKPVAQVLNRPQLPKPPFPYSQEEVSYECGEARLSGTLTLPDPAVFKSPFPSVILIAGSGRTDRDETLCGHKPFFVLADHLTRQGIAVLRVDKRGIGKSTGDFDSITTPMLAEDVLAGIRYLKTRDEIDPSQIGLIGHSEGGLIAPMIASKSKDVFFVVMMAGPAISGEKILYAQAELIQKAEGANEEAVAIDRKIREESFKILKQEPDRKLASAQLKDAISNHLASLTEEQKALLSPTQVSEANIEASIQQINTPWYRHFLTYDPADALKQVQVPALALIGELDLQVPPDLNLPVIEKALKEGGNPDFTIKKIPKHNHLFQKCETGSIWEYSQIEETMSPSVLNLISDWIKTRVE